MGALTLTKAQRQRSAKAREGEMGSGSPALYEGDTGGDSRSWSLVVSDNRGHEERGTTRERTTFLRSKDQRSTGKRLYYSGGP